MNKPDIIQQPKNGTIVHYNLAKQILFFLRNCPALTTVLLQFLWILLLIFMDSVIPLLHQQEGK